MSYHPVRQPRPAELIIRGLRHRLTWWDGTEPAGQSNSRPCLIPTADSKAPKGPAPIVLLHGFLDNGATWQFLVDCLPQHWSLVALDWRGFGDSEWAPGGYWFADYLADLEVLLDELSPQQPARVIGHSMGANVATLYAGIRPRRLQWLINLEGVGLGRTAPEQAPARYQQWLDELRAPLATDRHRSVAQLAAALRRRNPRLNDARAEFLARAWTRSVDEAQEVRLAFDPRHRLVNPILYRREEAEACWARVVIPLLLLCGGSSGHRDRRLAEFSDEFVHTVFGNARVVTLENVGHMMHHEDPQAVARCIVEFVSACDSAQHAQVRQ